MLDNKRTKTTGEGGVSGSGDKTATSHHRSMSKSVISAVVVAVAYYANLSRVGTTNNAQPEGGEIKLPGSEEVVGQIELGQYKTWEEAPASYEEFDHDNDPSVCRLPIVTVEEWEEKRMWEGETPVMVKNVTENWSALQHWTKEELMKRYPDMVVGMGNSKELGQGGGLRRTTISDYVLNWMHTTSKYVFHTLGMPEVENFLADCTPLPMPTRMYYEDREAVTQSSIPEDKMWKDHLAIAIGHDAQGLTFHRHDAAWNVVVFGTKRWILYDAERISNSARLKSMTRDVRNPIQLDSANWIRNLYHKDDRKEEIRTHGHDCIQRAGDLMYVPRGWAHMVLNIGDTVAVLSLRGAGGANQTAN